MRYEKVDELEELRRKAALYDEAMKQEPVAEVKADMSGAYILPSTLRPGQALYAHPIPQPDVRKWVEALRALVEVQNDDCLWSGDGHCQAHYLDHTMDGCRVAIARQLLAQWETQKWMP